MRLKIAKLAMFAAEMGALAEGIIGTLLDLETVFRIP